MKYSFPAFENGFIRAAAASPALRVADCTYNADQIIGVMREYAEKNVQLLCLPEFTLTGYTCSDLFWQSQMIDAAKEGLKEIDKFHKEFNEKYKIVPKEQWCVTITFSESINGTQTIGPFDDEKIAELFATIWNRKRDEFIDKTIADDPDGDHEFPYMKAKANRIDWSDKCEEIRNEIFETLGKL